MGKFAQLLAKNIESLGMKQKSVASTAGISYNYLQRLLSGDRNPSDQVVYKLAEAMRLSLEQTGELLAAAGYAPPIDLLHPIPAQEQIDAAHNNSSTEMSQATRLAQDLYRLAQEIPDTLQESFSEEMKHLLGYARYKYILSGGINPFDLNISLPTLNNNSNKIAQPNQIYLDLIAQLIGDLEAEPETDTAQEEVLLQPPQAIEDMLTAIDRLTGDILSGEISVGNYQSQLLVQTLDTLQEGAPWEIRRRIAEALPGLFKIDLDGAEHILETLRLDVDEKRGVDIRRRVVEALPTLAEISLSSLPVALRFLRPRPGDDFYVALATVEVCGDIQTKIKQTLEKSITSTTGNGHLEEEKLIAILQQSQTEISKLQRQILADWEEVEREGLQFSMALHHLLCAPDTMLLSLREGLQSSEKQIQLVAARYLERILPIRPLETLELYKMLLRSTARRNIRRAAAKALPALLQCLKEASLPVRALTRTVINDLATDPDVYIRRAVADHAMQIFHIDREFLLLLLREMRKDSDQAIKHRLQPVALRLAQVWLVWYAETAGLVDTKATKRGRNKTVVPFGE